MDDLLSRLVKYVDENSNITDLQFDPKLQPTLPYDPYSADPFVRKKLAHYLLLVASVDEGNVVGAAENARKLMVGCYSFLKEQLFSADQSRFLEALENMRMKFEARESSRIPSILESVNSFVSCQAQDDLLSYSKRFDTPFEFAEQISMNILRMGRTPGSTRKKTWMYMRWMVRGFPDLGLFDHLHPRNLFVPLDRNVARVAVCLNAIPEMKLGSLTWDDVVRVTDLARRMFPEDPAKVDYPFFLLGRKLRRSPTLSETSLVSAIVSN